MPATFNVSYTLNQTFVGQPNVVITVLPQSVAVSPVATRQPPYVIPSPNTGVGAIAVAGDVVMNISIVDATGHTMYPVGLALQNVAVRQLPNPAIFPPATVTQPTVITLGDNSSSDTRNNNYEFVILFQDINGFFGALDPRIVNDNG